MRKIMDVTERFWSKVDATGVCWEWTAAKTNGYGRFGVSAQEVVQAHRWSWEHLVGPIEDGLEIDHLCRNPACVNPDHLEPVDHTENIRRGTAWDINRSKTHCPQGHPYDEENTLVNSVGSRVCLTCKRARQRAQYTPVPRVIKTHCPQGHRYTEENLLPRKVGRGACRECNRLRGLARYAAIKRL